MNNKKVFIGVGHGGSDPGAVANGFKESVINLTIAKEVKNELERHNVEVKMSRVREENDDLSEEIKECNAYKPTLAVDIHTNAGGGDGFEVFHTIGGGTGKVLATNINSEVMAIGQNSRGVKTKTNSSGGDFFGFIRSTTCPAVIVEGFFIDNKTDLKDFDTDSELKLLAIAYVKGILKTLGVTYKPQVDTSKPEDNGETFYRVVVGSFHDRALADSRIKELESKGFKDAFVLIHKE